MLLTVRKVYIRSQVHLEHDTRLAVDEAVWLVNSDDPRTGEDVLADSATLFEYLDGRRVSGSRTGSATELRSIHLLRSRLREVFELAIAERLDATVDAINALIAHCGPMPRLVRHDGLPLHLHYTPPDAPLDQRLGAEMAIALAIVIRDGGIERLRACPAPGCGRVFVDLTKNQSRRYCDAQCANRVHAAAYRQRREV